MKPGRVAEDQVANPEACTTQGRCLLAVIRRTPRAASEALGGVEVSCHSQWVRALSVMSRGGRLEAWRHMATKDKGGSKSRKKTPTKTLKQKRQTKKAKQAGGTAK